MLTRCLMLLFLLSLATGPVRVRADVEKTAAEMEQVAGDKETVAGRYAGILVIPREPRNYPDGKYSQPYHAVCAVYVAERSTRDNDILGYSRRFLIYVPDRDALPIARRVARLLLVLWGENHERMHFDHPRDARIVQVWLTRKVGRELSADTAGEQFEDQIYLYDIFREREPVEWAREIAHEYGHYALPGISGFTAPEEWGNGVLGERLFLKWISEDLKAGRLHAEDLAFVTPEQLDTYVVLQVIPLVRRIAREGVKAKEMEKRDGEGMDYYTGAALALDTLYGSKMLLSAMSYTASPTPERFVQSPDFLHGIEKALRNAPTFTITLPVASKDSPSESLTLYLPAGEYTFQAEGPIHAWKFAEEGKVARITGKSSLVITQAGWRKITVALNPPNEAPARLTFQRKEMH